jgi:hypothetical protein
VSATAAVTLLLDLPRDYRAALNADDAAVRARPNDLEWSAIEYAAHAAEVLHSTSKRLILVFEQADRDVSPPHLEAVRASARTESVESVLASLGSACRLLARVVDYTPDPLWDQTARRNGRSVTARDLLTDALHEAHHHARDARLACRAAVARPTQLA